MESHFTFPEVPGVSFTGKGKTLKWEFRFQDILECSFPNSVLTKKQKIRLQESNVSRVAPKSSIDKEKYVVLLSMRIPKSNSAAEHRKPFPNRFSPTTPLQQKEPCGFKPPFPNRKITPKLVKSSWIFTYKTRH